MRALEDYQLELTMYGASDVGCTWWYRDMATWTAHVDNIKYKRCAKTLRHDDLNHLRMNYWMQETHKGIKPYRLELPMSKY